MLIYLVNTVKFMIKIIDVNISKIHKGEFSFRVINKTEQKKLVESIKNEGLKLAIGVKDNKNGTYTIFDGIRRFDACKELGYKTIPCYIKEDK